MLVDNEYVTMTASTILLIAKGQMHQPVESSDIKGWVMVFDEKILDPEIFDLTGTFYGWDLFVSSQ